MTSNSVLLDTSVVIRHFRDANALALANWLHTRNFTCRASRWQNSITEHSDQIALSNISIKSNGFLQPPMF